MSNVAVFDINETTLDLRPVRAVVDHLVGPEGGFVVWFQRLLQLAMTSNVIDEYTNFSDLGRHALDAVAETGGRRLAAGAWNEVRDAMAALEPHDDVVEGLTRLRAGGWSTLALTNSPLASVESQLERVGLTSYFDHVLSVDAVEVYKPDLAPYRLAAETAGVDPASMWMIACHDWDLAGARVAGCSTAYVERPGSSYADTFAPPDLTVADFVALAEALVG